MNYYLRIIKESIAIVILSSILGLFSGVLLSSNEAILYTIPIILLILPSLNSLIGDISTILVSRLTSNLYIGIIPPKIQRSERLKQDFFGLLITLLLSLAFLIILGYALALITGIKVFNPFLIIFVLLLTILLLFIIMFITMFISSIVLFKRGNDPNNLIPILTSLADFLTPLFLIMFLIIFI